MALSDATIKKFIKNGLVSIDPFEESNLTPAGYDLRAAQEVVLNSGEQRLAATLERVELAPDLLGVLHLRSSFTREGLFASLAVVDPGFRGQLTVSLLNVGRKPLKIGCGEPFLQLTIIQLSEGVERSYSGKYQESFGVVESKRRLYDKNLSNKA